MSGAAIAQADGLRPARWALLFGNFVITGLSTMLLAIIPWALGCLSANSGQQARLNATAPALASALMALNSSAMYLGQALGASSGGWLIAHGGYAPLRGVGLACLLAALALSLLDGRRSIGARP